MPNQTDSKRISISLKPELHKVISELAEHQNKPMSRVVVDLLEEMQPILEGMARGLAEVKKSNDPLSAVKKFSNEMLLEVTEAVGNMSKEIKKL